MLLVLTSVEPDLDPDQRRAFENLMRAVSDLDFDNVVAILDTIQPTEDETLLAPLADSIDVVLRSLKMEDQLLYLLVETFPKLASVRLSNDDAVGPYLLHSTCYAGDVIELRTLELLLNLNPRACGVTYDPGWFPLKNLVMIDAPFEKVKMIFDAYPDAIHKPSEGNVLLLHEALVQESSPEIIELLLDEYLEATMQQTWKGELPLHIACRRDLSFEIVQRLIDAYPAGLQHQSKAGDIPLHLACHANSSFELIELLVNIDFPKE